VSSPTNESRAVVAWMEVLDRIEHQLGQSLAADAETSGAPSSAFDPNTAVQRLDERLAGLQASLERAEANAATIDGHLKDEAEHLRRYLDGLHEIERKLADWVSRAV
jgi:hypothetical protein